MLLITDGLATDPPGGFEAGLSARFIGDPSVPVLVADSSEDIAERLVAASLAVSRMSDVPSRIFDQNTIV
jgi:hypothetical protein